MNYLAYVFLSHLPLVLEEKRIIDGKEEVCLLIPTSSNQIKKGKAGNWMMMCRLAECEPNARCQTHDIQLSYLTPEELQKSYDFGYHRRTAHMGRVYEHGRVLEKIDRTNNASDIDLRGEIVLSDIPKNLIFRNGQNNKRYITNLTFRGLQDNGFIYTGSICIDDIPREDIQTNNGNGKKFINVRLRKMERLDTYFNTHELVIARPDNECIQIGLFKEWKKEGYVPPTEPLPYISQNEPEKNLPNEIMGIKF